MLPQCKALLYNAATGFIINLQIMCKKRSDNDSSNCHCDELQLGMNKTAAGLQQNNNIYFNKELRVSDR